MRQPQQREHFLRCTTSGAATSVTWELKVPAVEAPNPLMRPALLHPCLGIGYLVGLALVCSTLEVSRNALACAL